jgi:hypothetical protein
VARVKETMRVRAGVFERARGNSLKILAGKRKPGYPSSHFKD